MNTPAPAVSSKVSFTCGTFRVRKPEDTWSIISPDLHKFGITRVADVTGLDSVGIPVAMAVRPLSQTLSVSQGKGRTLLLAKVSAAMEAIELWHAENIAAALSSFRATGAELDLPYAVADLESDPGSITGPRTPLRWVTGQALLSGRPVPLPQDTVSLAAKDPLTWRAAGLASTTNGLASGNNRAEATLHALYEVLERDAVARSQEGRARVDYVDPSTVDHDDCQTLITRLHTASCYVELSRIVSTGPVHCFTTRVWSEDFPVMAFGSGAHTHEDVALSRALTEAAQSRLTAIAGSRDDMTRFYDYVRLGLVDRPVPPADVQPWNSLPRTTTPTVSDLENEVHRLAQHLDSQGRTPIVVDLSSRDDFAVVKVVVPGLTMDPRARPAATAA
ncbi:YcaO-like family protein [Streptomyces anulatus]|uniref:YcaO-like family protein n=1 Tax=Streptomyces anulatus TaxID=1892 RepID=UPI002E81A88C|nr:YcaO-like family protein [Streptomyces anulatus]WUC91866.1 YcaO-like family protein [Streptomyces anulatus]